VFDTFIAPRTASRVRRPLILLGSGILHAALLAVWAIHSFWQVGTLSAPAAAVTLLSGFRATTPPPPSSTAPAARPRRLARRTPRPATPVSFEATPSPQLEAETDRDDGEDDPAPAAPVPAGATTGDQGPAMLPMEVVRAQLAIDPREDPYRPHLPPELNRPGARFFGELVACVNASGSVESARVVQSAHPLLDPELLSKVKTWKFHPYQVGGHPTPFCFLWRCSIRALWQDRR
jgi:outer membrane biosynthesis protein TonB